MWDTVSWLRRLNGCFCGGNRMRFEFGCCFCLSTDSLFRPLMVFCVFASKTLFSSLDSVFFWSCTVCLGLSLGRSHLMPSHLLFSFFLTVHSLSHCSRCLCWPSLANLRVWSNIASNYSTVVVHLDPFDNNSIFCCGCVEFCGILVRSKTFHLKE